MSEQTEAPHAARANPRAGQASDIPHVEAPGEEPPLSGESSAGGAEQVTRVGAAETLGLLHQAASTDPSRSQSIRREYRSSATRDGGGRGRVRRQADPSRPLRPEGGSSSDDSEASEIVGQISASVLDKLKMKWLKVENESLGTRLKLSLSLLKIALEEKGVLARQVKKKDEMISELSKERDLQLRVISTQRVVYDCEIVWSEKLGKKLRMERDSRMLVEERNQIVEAELKTKDESIFVVLEEKEKLVKQLATLKLRHGINVIANRGLLRKKREAEEKCMKAEERNKIIERRLEILMELRELDQECIVKLRDENERLRAYRASLDLVTPKQSGGSTSRTTTDVLSVTSNELLGSLNGESDRVTSESRFSSMLMRRLDASRSTDEADDAPPGAASEAEEEEEKERRSVIRLMKLEAEARAEVKRKMHRDLMDLYNASHLEEVEEEEGESVGSDWRV